MHSLWNSPEHKDTLETVWQYPLLKTGTIHPAPLQKQLSFPVEDF